jgi:hypothetical protein
VLEVQSGANSCKVHHKEGCRGKDHKERYM